MSAESFTPIDPEVFVATLGPDGSVRFRNRPWIRLLGESTDPWDAFDSADADEARRYVTESAGGSLMLNQLFLVPLTAAETPRPLLLHFIPVKDQSGRVVAITVTGELLVQPESWTGGQTERHRMETLGRMTMGMAHDFNNLLSGILGHAELMRLALPQVKQGQSLSEHVSTIEQAARDGASLVEKVQRYIRQEQQTSYEPVDLPSLIQDCISLTRPYWYNEPRRQGIDIRVTQDLVDVPPILGSAAELRDVLVNFILNAVQAMPEGGVLGFRTWEAGGRIRFSVSDTGSGMTAVVQERIFEPLFTTKGDRGNGMGLAVSYGIIQEHAGTIEVVSELGRGTTFSVDLPEAGRPLVTTPDPGLPSEEVHARILVVDDEEMVRTVLRRLLSLRGHEVDDADSGAAGLDRVASASYDVVITDQGMPGMSGREFAATARARGLRVPIILLTGDTHAGEPDDSISAVLGKPFRIDEVEATIRSLL